MIVNMTFEIDALDPLIPMLAIQHDFRERFFHALTEIVDVIESEGGSGRVALMKVASIARDALDHEKIQEWMANNRPMPWLDEIVGADGERLTVSMLDLLGE
jgi:hypothetical protein